MNKELATELFNQNKYFIETLTSKYVTYHNYDDILQQAYLTAWEALLRYNPESGIKITTYLYSSVTPVIKGYAIKEKYNGIIKKGNRIGFRILKIIGEGKRKGLTEQEIYNEVKKEVTWIDGDMWGWIWGWSNGEHETTSVVYQDDGEKNKDFCDETQNIEDSVCDKVYASSLYKAVVKVTDKYSKKNKKIYMDWFNNKLIEGNKTQEKIASENNCTRQNVNQVIKRTNEKIKNYLKIHKYIT